MKYAVLFLTFALTVCLGGSVSSAELPTPDQLAFPDRGIVFIPNHGQWSDEVLFRARTDGATIWFTRTGIVHDFIQRIADPTTATNSEIATKDNPTDSDQFERAIIETRFENANPDVSASGFRHAMVRESYFIGNDPDRWATDVPGYKEIMYDELYPGIDMKFFANAGHVQYEFICEKGADPSVIRLNHIDVESVARTHDGDLLVEKEGVGFVERGLQVFVDGEAGRESIDAAFVVNGSAVSFEMEDVSTRSGNLVIDPVIDYSGYLSGGGKDSLTALVVRGAEVYTAGYIVNGFFPLVNPFDATHNGLTDVTVTKVNADGTGYLYSTYFGGSGQDRAYGIDERNGDVYVCGYTSSANFPVAGQSDPTYSAGDAFAFRLTYSTNNLVYSGFLGDANGYETAWDIATASDGSAYVVGQTSSPSYPVDPDGYQTTFGGGVDAFVTRLASAGWISASTYLGGSSDDLALGVALDANGNVYVTGGTSSSNFPLQNPAMTYNSLTEAFVTKLGPALTSLSYSTFLAGSSYELAFDIAVDDLNRAYIGGRTRSTDFPLLRPLDNSHVGLHEGFLTVLTSGGNIIAYSTFLGGDGTDYVTGVAVDDSYNVYLTGITRDSGNFPTYNPFQAGFQGADSVDAFITKLNLIPGQNLDFDFTYSSYIGSGLGDPSADGGSKVAFDALGAAYVIGYTVSEDFYVIGGFPGTSYNGIGDSFLMRILDLPMIVGDVNYDQAGPNVSDLTYYVDWLFRGGSAPVVPSAADLNCDGNQNVSDLTFMVDYLFRGGIAPLC